MPRPVRRTAGDAGEPHVRADDEGADDEGAGDERIYDERTDNERRRTVSSSQFERHPDDDVLAEFAAEQLPADQALDVEAHVIGCEDCTRVLADGERVRQLLNRGDPGPMPDGVWARIQGALAAELAGSDRTASLLPPTGSFALQVDAGPGPAAELTEAELTEAEPTEARLAAAQADPPGAVPVDHQHGVPLPPPSMSFDEAPTAAWRRFLDDPPAPPVAPPVQARVGRIVRSSVRSRRDARSDEQSGRPWMRPKILIAAAAAGLAVLAAGGLGLKALLGDGSGASVYDVVPGPSNRSVVTGSGSAYTASTLAHQVEALVARVGSGSAPGRSASAAASSAGAAAGSPAPVPTEGTVADPKRLAACLTALGDGGRKPVAVDLARYEGREAAVIVLSGQAGGYDVWVVARSCSAADQGTLAFKKIAA
jgi:hypothetical protein